jgi:hypothetical protein
MFLEQYVADGKIEIISASVFSKYVIPILKNGSGVAVACLFLSQKRWE